MKTFLNYALCCIVAALALVGCETNNNTTPPSLELTAVDSTSSSIKFVINTDAEECSYMLYDGENINAETILNKGTASKSGVVTINSLEANTKYYVAVAARN